MAASCYNELMGLESWPANESLHEFWPLQDNGPTRTVRGIINGRDAEIPEASGQTTADRADEGPTDYLPLSFFSGARDGGERTYIEVPTISSLPDRTFVVALWAQAFAPGTGNIESVFEFRQPDVRTCFRPLRYSGESQSNGVVEHTGLLDNYNFAASYDGTQWALYTLVFTAEGRYVYHGKTLIATDTRVISDGSSSASRIAIGNGPNAFSGGNNNFYGRLAGVGLFLSSAWSGDDVGQYADGPEPVFAGVSPVIDAPDGSAVGDMLAVTDPGTWDLPAPFAGLANGPLTYQYRWIRSGHGVIDGATDATYTLTGDDYGRSVWAEVLAGNDGGTDPSQWAASNAIAVEEITNVTPPTLQINADGTWTGTLGTWSGNPTNYAWELRRASDDSVVDSGSTSDAEAVLVGSGLSVGNYYLWVEASNSGGSGVGVSGVGRYRLPVTGPVSRTPVVSQLATPVVSSVQTPVVAVV